MKNLALFKHAEQQFLSLYVALHLFLLFSCQRMNKDWMFVCDLLQSIADDFVSHRTTVLGVSFGMAFLLLALILGICFAGHILVSGKYRSKHKVAFCESELSRLACFVHPIQMQTCYTSIFHGGNNCILKCHLISQASLTFETLILLEKMSYQEEKTPYQNKIEIFLVLAGGTTLFFCSQRALSIIKLRATLDLQNINGLSKCHLHVSLFSFSCSFFLNIL